MPERPYPDAALLRDPARWQALPRERGRETARLRLGDGDAPWGVLLVRPGQPLAGDDAFAALSLVDHDTGGTPAGLSRLLPLASGPMSDLPPGEEGVEAMRAALAASADPPAQARIAAGQALAEVVAAVLPDGTSWRLHGPFLKSQDARRSLAAFPLPPDLLQGIFVWTDPSEDDGVWPLPWRGALLGGIRGRCGPATAHRRADLIGRAETLLSDLLGACEARRILDRL